jgi:hypothetical protein
LYCSLAVIGFQNTWKPTYILLDLQGIESYQRTPNIYIGSRPNLQISKQSALHGAFKKMVWWLEESV